MSRIGAILVALLLLLPGHAVAQTVILSDSLDVERWDFLPFFWLRHGWTTHPGDDRDRAFDRAETTGWTPVLLNGYRDRYVVPRVDADTGIGWSRTTFTLSPDLVGQDLALLVAGAGAFEVFLDGRRVHAAGRVADSEEGEVGALQVDAIPVPVAFRPETAGPFTLAVRYSGHWLNRHPHLRYHRGVAIGLLRLADATPRRLASVVNRTTYQAFFTAAALGFAFLHGLLFLLYPRIRTNLYYALFTVSVAGVAFIPIQVYGFVGSFGALYVLDLLWKGVLLLAVSSSIRFLTVAFSDRLSLFARALEVAAVIGVPLAPVLTSDCYYTLVLASFVEMARLAVLGLVRRRPGARTIAAGFAILISGSAHAMLLELNVVTRIIPYSYLYAILGLLVAMAAYLARAFSASSHDLEKQIEEVQTLTERRLEQERQIAERERLGRDVENRRRLLEADNALKARELAESRKRQGILEALDRSTRELERTQGQLMRSEKLAALGNLVAGIAHEINTPVGAINSMHDTLVRAVSGLRDELAQVPDLAGDARIRATLGAVDDANRVIASGTERVTRIAQSLRAFARLDEAEMMEADLNAGIDATLPLLEHAVRQRVDIVRDYGELPLITCFPSRLNQVFLNLLLNAAQSIDGPGTITIRTRVTDRGVIIAIADTGSGIPAEHLDQVFDPGFTTKGVGVGTGLGLSICYQIVQDHGGDIYIRSTEGEGTTVTIELPLLPPAPGGVT